MWVMVVMVDWVSVTSVDSRWDSGGIAVNIVYWGRVLGGGGATNVLAPPSPCPYNTLSAHASPARSPCPPPHFLQTRFSPRGACAALFR